MGRAGVSDQDNNRGLCPWTEHRELRGPGRTPPASSARHAVRVGGVPPSDQVQDKAQCVMGGGDGRPRGAGDGTWQAAGKHTLKGGARPEPRSHSMHTHKDGAGGGNGKPGSRSGRTARARGTVKNSCRVRGHVTALRPSGTGPALGLGGLADGRGMSGYQAGFGDFPSGTHSHAGAGRFQPVAPPLRARRR